MIFVTTGVQLPFDRLIRTMDNWAGAIGRTDVVAQVGASTYECRNIQARRFLNPDEFLVFVKDAELVVAHAGMGSIITALELGKPIVVMPRKAALMEHRNDHQLSTARHMAKHGLIQVAADEGELVDLLNKRPDAQDRVPISSEASPELIEGLRNAIRTGPRRSIFSRASRR